MFLIMLIRSIFTGSFRSGVLKESHLKFKNNKSYHGYSLHKIAEATRNNFEDNNLIIGMPCWYLFLKFYFLEYPNPCVLLHSGILPFEQDFLFHLR